MKQSHKITLLVLAIAFLLNYKSTANNDPKLPTGFKPKTTSGISFTENKGQVCDQNYKPRPDVLFSGTDGQLTFHLKNNGISYQLNRIDAWKKREDSEQRKTPLALKDTSLVPDQSTIYRLDINWLNANTKANITKGNHLEGYNNYYLEQCPNGAVNVKSFENITYQNIYSGIDLKWYQKDGHLKYDYMVAAGADYKQIQLNIEGAEKISINSNGELVLETPLGKIIEEAPLVNQNGKELESKWVIENGNICFDIENLNPNQAFIIDPVVRNWGTYYGGVGTDATGFSCATDATGNLYLAGYTTSNTGTVIATSGAHQSLQGGVFYDSFLAKFNSGGVRQWGTYYGGGANDRGYSCTTDAAGNVYLAGETVSNTGTAIATVGAHQSAYGGGIYDAFLVKFNSSGLRQWGTYYGGTGDDYGYSCTTDATGNVYLAGSTASNTGTVIATAVAHQTAIGGIVFSDAFLVKFNSSGVRQWGTYYGGTGSDNGISCATDVSGNVYLTGWTDETTGTVIATVGAHQASHGGGAIAYLVKFNSGGVRQWGTYYGGATGGAGRYCTTDATGNVYLTGETNPISGTVIATLGSHQPTHGGNGTYDAFLAKFNSLGVRQWGTFYGGTGYDYGYSCATDAFGNVYLSGTTDSNTGTVIATVGAHQSAIGGNTDAFLVKFNSSGLRQWGTYYGDVGYDWGFPCTADAAGNLYLAGYTDANTGAVIATVGAHQSLYGGNNDAFLVQFSECPPTAPSNITTPTNQSLCANNSTTISAAGSGTISWFASSGSTVVLGTGVAFTTPTLAAGTHSYYAEAFACAQTSSRTIVTLTVNALPLISASSGSICIGQTFTLNPSGASSYTYNSGSATVAPINTSTYSIVGSSSVGCISNNTAVITVSVAPLPTISVNSGSICLGNTFTLSPSGASSYTYSGGSALVSPPTNTTYAVTGTSSLGCISSNTAIASLTVASLPTVSVNSGTICSGTAFVILPSGANTYTVQGGTTTVSPISASTYTVRGTGLNGCISANTATSNVTVNITPTVIVNSGTICSGNAFVIVPSGANTYTVQGGSNTVSPLSSLSYTVNGSSLAGCISANTATSNVTVHLTPTVSVNSGSICSGSTFTLAPSGASNYTYSGGSNLVSPSTNTTYAVTGTSSLGCVSSNTANASITVAPLPTVSVNNGTICSGTAFVIVPSGANTYTVQGGTHTVSPISATSYTVKGTGLNGCISANTATSNVTVNTTPTVSVISGSICSGNAFVIVPNGANTYTVQGGTNTVSPLSTSNYTVNGTSALGCISANTATSSVTVNITPTLSVNSGTICSGATFTLFPTGAHTYSISGGSATLSPATTTSYSVTGTSAVGCAASNTAVSTVTVYSLPNLLVSTSSTFICVGESVTLTASGANTYSWNNGATANIVIVSPMLSTTYSVSGFDINGCTKAALISQIVSPCTTINHISTSEATFLIYPNPTNGEFTIDTPNETDVTIINALGQIIKQQYLIEGQNKIDLNEHAKGIYFMKTKNSNFKILKE
jgi:hypothetical protein